MERILRALFFFGVVLIIDFILVLFGVAFVPNPLMFCLVFFCLDWLFSVVSRRTEFVVVKSKGLLVKRFSQYIVIKTSDGRVFANRNDWPMKVGVEDWGDVLKVGCKYKITSYKQLWYSERNILGVCEVKSHGRKKVTRKSK